MILKRRLGKNASQFTVKRDGRTVSRVKALPNITVFLPERVVSAIETLTLIVALLGVALGIANTWYLFKSPRFRLKVVPKLCFDIQGGRYLAVDWDEQVQQLRAAGALSRWGIEVANLSAFAVTIDEIGFSDNTDDGQIAMVDPEISRGKRWPVRLKPREKVMYYSTDGTDLPKTVLGSARAYAKTDCGHCVYGTSPVLTKEAHMMLRSIPVPLAKPLAFPKVFFWLKSRTNGNEERDPG
jgi:hypothetical protein